MKLIAFIFALATLIASAQVKPGVEVLRDSKFAALNGKRVGLITNPTGVDRQLKSTIDILHEAENVKLVSLFAPEHGVRGDVHAGDKVAATTDARTGVKVHSLYGKNTKPTAAMLKGIDALVYDIQDIGCRSYTFISTMGAAMEACAECGVEFVVLDRPNPLGGNRVEGPGLDSGMSSIVGRYNIPYIYGLTPGELATMLNEEKMLRNGKKVKLTVIPMQGWSREMTFCHTGMPWVLPSPHIPSPETALYYPATGILGELSVVSIGVGYTLPFQLICASWINAERFADAMNALNLHGVHFRPIHIKPYYSIGKDSNIQGVQVYISPGSEAQITLIQFYAMQELARLYPTHKAMAEAEQTRLAMFDKVTGSKAIRTQFAKRHMVDDILPLWNSFAAEFKARSAKYHLY